MRRLLLSTIVLLFAISGAMAQDRTVSGRVTSSDDGSGLPGVNVVLKGTTTGTATDTDGRYTLSVPSAGGTLVFSFIGLATQEVVIGERTVVDVGMSLDATQLQEVVVTGQGITQSRKALGYAISVVGENQLSARPMNDISRVLQGKIPGVIINPTGGTAGAGSQINIRGYSTITGNTQPLWVVDGVPFSSATNDQSSFNTGGSAAPSRFLDIDPNTIESINVLKGLAATVLYGDQGRNGVILVNTKAGTSKRRGTEISFQQSLSLNEIASLPDFQNDYGNGFQQLYGNFFSNWGANFDEFDSIGHPYQFLSSAAQRLPFADQTYFERIPWSAAPSVGGFFRDGLISNTSLSVAGGTDKLGINASVGYTTEEGYAPGNNLQRLNASVGFNGSLTEKFSIKSTLMYTNTDMETPPLNGATGGSASFSGVPSLYANFLYTPRNLNINDTDLFPFETPEDKLSVWYRGGNDIPNARWISKYMRETDVTNRFFTSTSFSYDFSDNSSLQYRVGLDYFVQQQGREMNKGVGAVYNNPNQGIYQTQTISNTIWNHDLIYSLHKELSSDLRLVSRIGANARNDYTSRDGIFSQGQAVFGEFRHSNFSVAASNASAFDGRVFERTTEQQRYGIYADFSFDYKSYLYVNLAGRNDWSSNLESENNSLFYPSVSASFLPTEAFENLKSNVLSSLKIRAGYGTSAGFGPVYGTRTVVTQNPRAFVDNSGAVIGAQSISNRFGNAGLRPELQQEIEAGFEVGLFKGRMSLDFTVYDRSTKDLITDAPIDPSSGYNTVLLNLGKLSNKGIEFALNATPVRTGGGFQWDITWNFTQVRPVVENLGDIGLEQVQLINFTDGSTSANFAKPGRPTNIIMGTVIQRDPDGNRIVGGDGLHVLSPIIGELGDPNPDYYTTLINTFSYKGITFGFQFDYRKGGQMMAWTPAGLLARGVLAGRDNFDRDQIFILPGVKNIGDSENPQYVPNDIQITAADYGFSSQFFDRNDNSIFDVTTIRLREVSLGYTFPRSLLGKTGIKGASIILTGNNLWFNAVNVPEYVNYDPEVSSTGVNSGVGFDYLTGPSMRRYGAVLRLTF